MHIVYMYTKTDESIDKAVSDTISYLQQLKKHAKQIKKPKRRLSAGARFLFHFHSIYPDFGRNWVMTEPA